MTHASLFSGIGGPEVAAAMLGWSNAFHCEINPFGRQVLEYWFPDSVSYEDITKTDFKEWRGKIDVLTGGFPCQPFSYAGKRGGREDERYLWPEMLRAIDEIRPTWVVGENVAGLATMVEGWVLTDMGCSGSLFDEGDDVHGYVLTQTFTIERICQDLERLGYTVQPVLIPAAAVGAPHRRDRIFILAHVADTDVLRRQDGASGIGREYKKHRDARSGNSQRLRPEAGTDAANSDGTRRGQMDEHLQPELADGAEPFSLGRERTSADTHGAGLQESKHAGREADSQEAGGRIHHRAVRPRLYGPASHAFCERLSAAVQSGCYDAEERDDDRRSVGMYSDDAWAKGTWWNHFPTVSPVHTRDDGLSQIMDGTPLGFHKWRNEAIKAYGNAIVPQVMYRIFQAIEGIISNP